MRNIKLSAKEPRMLRLANSLIETLIASVFLQTEKHLISDSFIPYH